jgi:hypothetical protein
MTDDSELRPNARGVPGARKLPDRPPKRLWGGRGTGAPCAVCSEPVEPDEVEYELDFARDCDPAGSGERGTDTRHVHVRCFAAWESERRRRHAEATPGDGSLPGADAPEGATSSVGRSAMSRRALPSAPGEASLAGREPEAAGGRRRP